MKRPARRRSSLGVLAAIAVAGSIVAAGTAYDVTPLVASDPGEELAYSADNPAQNLRFTFTDEGVAVAPLVPAGAGFSLELSVAGIGVDGRVEASGPPSVSATGTEVVYDYAAVAASYVNTEGGLTQRITIKAPPVATVSAGMRALAVELTFGGDVTPRVDGYFVDLATARGEGVLRYGAVTASDANGTVLPVRLELASSESESEPRERRVRIVVDAVDPVYPVELRAAASSKRLSPSILDTPQSGGPGEIVGVPVTLAAGITETVDEIMSREKAMPPRLLARPRETHHELENDIELQDDPNAPPPLSHWPPIPATTSPLSGDSPNLPQTVGTTFKAVGVAESGYIPPDSMGAVGPTQIVVHVNGRIKSFNKVGSLDGALNASDAAFWASVAPGGVSDPQVRYDRLSGRWFLLGITVAEATNNKITVAVSSGPTITGAASFTFYSFPVGTPSPPDATSFCDYPGFGIDANALYTGCNMFSSAGAFRWTSAFVIRKSSVTGGGPIVVTGFPTIATTTSAGPYSPRGVDNDDPTWTEGYIIGTDPGFTGRINIRRVSDPGGTPALGANVTLVISSTSMSNQPALGSSTAVNSSDVRLFAAAIHKNKITDVTSLWTAHSVETNTACTPSASGSTRRIGAKWYEIGSLTATPSITQFGTLCTTAAGAAVLNSERGFLYPTVIETGQGHMALSASFSSANEFVGVAAAGRLRTDLPAGTRAPETIVLSGAASYTLLDTGARNRWGDYSNTVVDPNDDQTVWTFQEYADVPANTWSVRAVQLKAPPPPVLLSATPVCAGLAATVTTVTGADSCALPSCTSGLCTGGGVCPEFFDPGADPGGPGYANHITGAVTGGVLVNPYPASNIVIPGSPTSSRVLQATMSLNTTFTGPGPKTITITNPDGQFTTSATPILTIIPAPAPPVASNDGPICAGGTLSLSASTVAGATYAWTGPDGFASSDQNPSIAGATAAATGIYSVTVTVGGCASSAATTTAAILADGVACDDSDDCTFDDACAAETCQGTTVTCTTDACGTRECNGTASCTVTPAEDGTPCDDGNACTSPDACGGGSCQGVPVGAPGEVFGVRVDTAATISWTPSAGSVVYDIASQTLSDLRVNGTVAATCLANDVAGTDYVDVQPGPPAEEGFYYIVRAQSACGDGGYGFDSAGSPRTPASACP